eukprot:m.165523 g.165523  ORF g.165523 m.165523 type:complete len:891 (+) comp38891_c0_seq1:229-2901(+)
MTDFAVIVVDTTVPSSPPRKSRFITNTPDVNVSPDPGYGSGSPMSSSDTLPSPEPASNEVVSPPEKGRWSVAQMEGLGTATAKVKPPQKRHQTFPGRNEDQSFPQPMGAVIPRSSFVRARSPLASEVGSTSSDSRHQSYSAHWMRMREYSQSIETNIDGDIEEAPLSEDDDDAFQESSGSESSSSASFLPGSSRELQPPALRLRARSQSPTSNRLPRAKARISLHGEAPVANGGKRSQHLLPVPESPLPRTKSFESMLENGDEGGDTIGPLTAFSRSRSIDFLADIGRERKYSTIEVGFPAGPVPAAEQRRSSATKSATVGSFGSLLRRCQRSFRKSEKSIKTVKKSTSTASSVSMSPISTVLSNPFRSKKGTGVAKAGERKVLRVEARNNSEPFLTPPSHLKLQFDGHIRRYSDCPVPILDSGTSSLEFCSIPGSSRSGSISSARKRSSCVSDATVMSACEGIRLCLADWEEKLNSPSEQGPVNTTTQYADKSWQQAVRSSLADSVLHFPSMEEKVVKLKAAVWELARNECEYLEGLLVLKDVFKASLEFLQERDHLLYVNKDLLFANLEEICQVSDFLAKTLLDLFINKTPKDAGDLEEVAKIFTEIVDVLLSSYKRYCINYKKIKYQELLKWWKQCSGFPLYEQSCMKHVRTKRRAIDDLLITPFNRLVRYIPLLEAVTKHCSEEDEKIVAEVIDTMKGANRTLDDTLRSLDEYDVVFELQRNLVWPTVGELDRNADFPPCLTEMLSPDHQGCNFFLANGQRNIIHYRPVILREGHGATSEMYFFLFDDLILLTKFKANSASQRRASFSGKLPNGTYSVFKQPLPLDRIKICDVSGSQGWEKCFSIVHYSRFVQVLGVYTFQAISEGDKNELVQEIARAQGRFKGNE